MKSLKLPACALLLLASLTILPAATRADKVTLKDGTVLQGKTIPEGNGYWFKDADGQTRHIDESEIASIERGSVVPSPDSGATDTAGLGGNLAYVKGRAEMAESATAAVAIWQQFIDSKPVSSDLAIARQEMARWKKMEADGAERIRGHWVSGDELKAIIEKARALHNEGVELLKANQTLQAVKKLEEAQSVYPNSFTSTFVLGYLYTLQKDDTKALGYLEQALRLQPNSAEALGNMALCQYHKHQLLDAVMTAYKAAESGDTPEIAQNLFTLIAKLNALQRDSERMRPVIEASNLLVAKYNITSAGPLFLVPLRAKSRGEAAAPPGAMYSGSGFLISPDGLILTNRHVVDGSKTLTVLLDGKTQRAAQVVNIDSEQDLALIKVKSDVPLPFVQLSVADSPAPGAECTVMGFPLIDRFGESIKITRGIVASKGVLEAGADVMLDAKVNPGNSGGPVLDKNGNVMAIICMKSLSNSMEDSYGLAISTGLIRRYLAKEHVAPPGGVPAAAALTTEQIAAKVTPAAVCILSTR